MISLDFIYIFKSVFSTSDDHIRGKVTVSKTIEIKLT